MVCLRFVCGLLAVLLWFLFSFGFFEVKDKKKDALGKLKFLKGKFCDEIKLTSEKMSQKRTNLEKC